MPEFLEVTVDKFTFKVGDDRCYTLEGVWALADGNRVRIGLSDFLQQRSGDIGFRGNSTGRRIALGPVLKSPQSKRSK